MHDKAALPSNTKLFVQCFGVKEAIDILLKSLLEGILEDDIIPVGLLDFEPEVVVLLPEALVEDPDLFMKFPSPCTNGKDELADGILWSIVEYEVLHSVISFKVLVIAP